MKSLKQLKKLVHKKTSESGFTLSNIMIGAALTGVVVSGAGAGLATMADISNTSNAKNERRVEMTRALDFMSTEIKSADTLTSTTAQSTAFQAALPNIASQVKTNTISVKLTLDISGSDEAVVYFTAEPKSGTWTGPRVLYRWGPEFSTSSDYVNAADATTWGHTALIDRIEDFSTTVNTAGNSASLNLNGKINKYMGRSETYATRMNAGVGSTAVRAAAYTPDSGATATAIFTKNGGGIDVLTQSTMTVKLLGGDITCGAGGPAIPTSASISLTGGTTVNQANVPSTGEYTYSNVSPNTTLNVTGTARGNSSSGGCRNYSFSTNTSRNSGSQVLTLVNGDSVPLFAPFGGQRSLDTFLRPYIDSTTGKVTLESNQVIYLFELGTTNRNSAAYDMQDLVVLATIRPTTSTTTTTTTSTTSTTSTVGSTTGSRGCNNGLGNGSEGCTPGKARPNDEIVRDAYGNVTCMPAPGNPCSQASASASSSPSPTASPSSSPSPTASPSSSPSSSPASCPPGLLRQGKCP
jgi:type II secretory pathway component PulJ